MAERVFDSCGAAIRRANFSTHAAPKDQSDC